MELPDLMKSDGTSLEKSGDGYKALCMFHEEKTPSLSLFRGKNGEWRYYCFGCGASGNDVEYLKQAHDMTVQEAMLHLHGEGTPRCAPNPATEPVPKKERKRKVLDALPENHAARYTYRDRNANVLFVVQRYYRGDEKYFGQYSKREDGRWEKGMTLSEDRPLYGLFTLTRSDTARPVMVVEGEKCADLVHRNFPNTVVVSWFGGDSAWSRTDWTPLYRRHVMLVCDANAVGILAMANIAEMLEEHCTIQMIIPKNGDNKWEKNGKWDIGDLIEKKDRKEVMNWIRGNVHEWDDLMRDRIRQLRQWKDRQKQRSVDMVKAVKGLENNPYFDLFEAREAIRKAKTPQHLQMIAPATFWIEHFGPNWTERAGEIRKTVRSACHRRS